MSESPINFYFLSTGFCSTRFHHHVLGLATNAEVWHQPGHEDIAEIVNLLEERFTEDPEGFLGTTIAEFPRLKRRIDKRLSLPWVYGDTLNWMRALAYILYQYIGPKRLRLVQLVRHPVATCRSMLADGRKSLPEGVSDIALAEETARRWVLQYACIRHQFQAIDDETVCRTIRLEDTSLDQIKALYDFLSLEGFDEAAVGALLADETQDVRHYHRRDAPVQPSREELHAIWDICAPLAAAYGYVEDPVYYEEAPSRPIGQTSAPVVAEPEEPRAVSAQLLDYRGLGLIVRCPSGIQYVNLCGGPIAFWLRTEGTFVPLAEGGEGSPAHKLLAHFLLCRDKEMMRGIRKEDADFIDAVLAENAMGFIRVIRSRIGEEWDVSSWGTWYKRSLDSAPWEAWVPVEVNSVPYSRIQGVLSGCSNSEAVLVWENSN